MKPGSVCSSIYGFLNDFWLIKTVPRHDVVILETLQESENLFTADQCLTLGKRFDASDSW